MATSTVKGTPGLTGENTALGDGVWGRSDAGRGVVGISEKTTKGAGADQGKGTGVWGEADQGRGVVGVVKSGDAAGVWGAGVWGQCAGGRGVVGVSNAGDGVWGESGLNKTPEGTLIASGRGVIGIATGNAGVWGEATTEGLTEDSKVAQGVIGIGHGASSVGVLGRAGSAGALAGKFEGTVVVTGDLVVRGEIKGTDIDEIRARIDGLALRLRDLDKKNE